MKGRTSIAAAAVAAALLCPRPAAGQAWTPAQGEGSVTLLFQDALVKDHFFERGQRRDRGEIRSNTLIADVTYGITDRLAVTVGVPFVRARYRGGAPHPTAQDDGASHYGFQDFRGSLRYNVLDGPLVVTPFVGTNLPTHEYQYFAHAALGIRVREVEVGAYVGRVLSPALPNAFVQVRYSYAFPETIVGVERRRSNLDVEVGYFLTRRLRAFAMSAGHKTHGGIRVPEQGGYNALPEYQRQHHDRIGTIDLLDVSTGAQFTVNRSLDLFGSFTRSLAGRNTHAIDRAFTVGASWSFGGRLGSLLSAVNGGSPPPAESAMVRCLCVKKAG